MIPDRELTPYEIEVGEAMTARRDAALRLQETLARDISGYEDGMATIRSGKTMEILVPPAAGKVRQDMSHAVIDFETARHRFRLSLVAIAVDHGMNARQIGDAFAFSRQLASRYLKEARDRWPDLEVHDDEQACTDDAAPVERAPTGDGVTSPHDRSHLVGPGPGGVPRA